MDESAVKEARVILRQIQAHVLNLHRRLGAVQESAGMVDLVHHPSNPHPALNYVLPRRNTAWVPSSVVEDGLGRLRERRRRPDFQYIEGLFPAQFAAALLKLGLAQHTASAVMVFHGRPALPPAGVRIRRVSAERGARAWQQAAGARWAGVFPGDAGGAPVSVGAVAPVDLIAFDNRLAAGLVRLEMDPENGTAQLVGLAVGTDRAGAPLTRALVGAGVRAARRAGCRLVFATVAAGKPQRLFERLGFAGMGRLVRYTAPEADEEALSGDGSLAQPVPAGR